MELYKLKKLRDTLEDRIKKIEGFIDRTWDYLNKPSDYLHNSSLVNSPHENGRLKGLREASIEEVKFLDSQLQFIRKEIENHPDVKGTPTGKEYVTRHYLDEQWGLKLAYDREMENHENAEVDKPLDHVIVKVDKAFDHVVVSVDKAVGSPDGDCDDGDDSRKKERQSEGNLWDWSKKELREIKAAYGQCNCDTCKEVRASLKEEELDDTLSGVVISLCEYKKKHPSLRKAHIIFHELPF